MFARQSELVFKKPPHTGELCGVVGFHVCSRTIRADPIVYIYSAEGVLSVEFPEALCFIRYGVLSLGMTTSRLDGLCTSAVLPTQQVDKPARR